MRSPGGNTPDLIAISINANYYKVYADVIAFNQVKENLETDKYISVSVSRRDTNKYAHNYEDIAARYGDKLREHGRYPHEIAVAMGDEFFFARFKTIEEVNEFKDFVYQA